jgi:hypothetical protein
MECRGGPEAISYPAMGLPLLLPMNRILLIFNSGAAISSHATAFS